jgi:hypothetical protein
MTWLAEHTWAIPLIAQFLWLFVCYGLLWVLTGGMAFQVVILLLLMGSTAIWCVYGGFNLLVFLIEKWN